VLICLINIFLKKFNLIKKPRDKLVFLNKLVMIEYCLGEPIPVSDTDKIYKYRVSEHLAVGDILPATTHWVNSRNSSTFKDCTVFNLKLDYKPLSKTSKGFCNDFKRDNTIKAPCTVDVILENSDYDITNNQFCVREIKAFVTLKIENDRYYWSVIVRNYDIYDKLEDKVNNILPILQYGDIYENNVGISLTIDKIKAKMIVDFFCNLLDKNQIKEITEKVRLALMYL